VDDPCRICVPKLDTARDFKWRCQSNVAQLPT
jgi:hypothetical protein